MTLDSLEKIADACGLKAWHLLLEDFDPAAPPSRRLTYPATQCPLTRGCQIVHTFCSGLDKYVLTCAGHACLILSMR